MLRYIAIALLLVVFGVFIAARLQPDSLRVERTTTIAAPPGPLFERIYDLRRWTEWSPYERKDPQMKRTYSGAEAGVGAVYEWSGDSNVGSGRMQVIEAESPTKVAIQLDFVTPFEGHNIATFQLVPEGEATQVTWVMEGPNSSMGKLIGLFLDMDEMIGRDFEDGLARLKSLAEAEARSAMP